MKSMLKLKDDQSKKTVDALLLRMHNVRCLDGFEGAGVLPEEKEPVGR